MKNSGYEYNNYLQDSLLKSPPPEDYQKIPETSKKLLDSPPINNKISQKNTFSTHLTLISESLMIKDESERSVKFSENIENFSVFCGKLNSYIINYRNDLRDKIFNKIFILSRSGKDENSYKLIKFYIFIYHVTKAPLNDIEKVKFRDIFFIDEIDNFQTKFKMILNDEKLVPILKKELEEAFINLQKKYMKEKSSVKIDNIIVTNISVTSSYVTVKIGINEENQR